MKIIINTPNSIHYSYGISCLDASLHITKYFWHIVVDMLDREIAMLNNIPISFNYFGLFKQGYDELDGWVYCECLGKDPNNMTKSEQNAIFNVAEKLSKEYNATLEME